VARLGEAEYVASPFKSLGPPPATPKACCIQGIGDPRTAPSCRPFFPEPIAQGEWADAADHGRYEFGNAAEWALT
jgi:hypothetical protein